MIGAVDIGGTKIAAAVVGESGSVQAQVEWPTSAQSPQGAVHLVVEWLNQWSRRSGVAVSGIGVGCTGPVDPWSGVVGEVDLLPGWAGFPLAQRLSEEAGVRVAVENDADAATLAEARWGAGAGSSRFIYVTVSTGIGTGMVIDNVLYRGLRGSHPEAGHQGLDPAGPACYCGARGCWESLASGPAMAAWVKSNAGARQFPSDLSAKEICNLARAGDPLSCQAVAREAFYLGLGLANLVTVFCPDIIALGGGLMRSADLFLDQAREIVRARCGLVPARLVTIRLAALGGDVALLGAARVWQARFGEAECESSAT